MGASAAINQSKQSKAKVAFYSQSTAEFGRKSLYATPPHVGSNVKVAYSRSPGSAVFCGDVWSTPLPKVFWAYGLTGMEKTVKIGDFGSKNDFSENDSPSVFGPSELQNMHF